MVPFTNGKDSIDITLDYAYTLRYLAQLRIEEIRKEIPKMRNPSKIGSAHLMIDINTDLILRLSKVIDGQLTQ